MNNNAAAVYLVLSTYGWGGREVVVSRGELVEIGGSFRVPDVMARAGVRLREVGTTNRTHLEDYRAAIGPQTALLMKVHTSNFRVQGFVAEVTPDELAVLGRAHGVPSVFDLGSGMVDAPPARPLPSLGNEPRVRAAIDSGVDLVTFSGDKLLGAPQAGIIAGKREAVAAMRANPLYRALRMDKTALAGLERTLELLLAGRGDELPARRMLLLSAEELKPRAHELAKRLGALAGLAAEAKPSTSQPGSGSAPGIELDTWAVRVTHKRHSADELGTRLRRADPPVFVRITDGAVWLDPRTLLPGDEERLLAGFQAALTPGTRPALPGLHGEPEHGAFGAARFSGADFARLIALVRRKIRAERGLPHRARAGFLVAHGTVDVSRSRAACARHLATHFRGAGPCQRSQRDAPGRRKANGVRGS